MLTIDAAFRGRMVLGRKERCWYRLHASKLYNLELRRATMGDVPVCVFDLRKGATVAKRPGDAHTLSDDNEEPGEGGDTHYIHTRHGYYCPWSLSID